MGNTSHNNKGNNEKTREPSQKRNSKGPYDTAVYLGRIGRKWLRNMSNAPSRRGREEDGRMNDRKTGSEKDRKKEKEGRKEGRGEERERKRTKEGGERKKKNDRQPEARTGRWGKSKNGKERNRRKKQKEGKKEGREERRKERKRRKEKKEREKGRKGGREEGRKDPKSFFKLAKNRIRIS